MRRRVLVTSVVAAIAALQWLGRTAGSTRGERARALAGDDLVPAPHLQTDHAATLDAPPAEVWPWLVQVGWGRGGWYTARWVDRLLFPANGPSADQIIPDLQHLAIGDRILDGPPEAECAFRVVDLQPERRLVLLSTEHLPPGVARRFGAWIRWSWVFELTPIGAGQTRLHMRSRASLGPAWLAAAYVLLVVPADFVMSRQMLDGLRGRVPGASGPWSHGIRPFAPAAGPALIRTLLTTNESIASRSHP